MVRQPKLILFDKLLSNLDAELHVSMRTEVARSHRELRQHHGRLPHAQTGAMTQADQFVVLRHRYIEQIDPPSEACEDPANSFIAG